MTIKPFILYIQGKNFQLQVTFKKQNKKKGTEEWYNADFQIWIDSSVQKS